MGSNEATIRGCGVRDSLLLPADRGVWASSLEEPCLGSQVSPLFLGYLLCQVHLSHPPCCVFPMAPSPVCCPFTCQSCRMVMAKAGVGTLAEGSVFQLCRGASGPTVVGGTPGCQLTGHHTSPLLPFRGALLRAEGWQSWFWPDYPDGRIP